MRFALILALVLSQAPSSTPTLKPVGASSTARTKTEPPKTKQAEVGSLPSAEDRLADYTLVLTVFTGILMVAALYQGLQLRNTVDQMRVSEQRELRAYVLLDSVAPLADTPLPQIVPYRITVKNSGQTPAYDVQFQAMSGIGPVKLTGAPPIAEFEAGKGSKTTMGPGGFSYKEFNPTILTPEQLAAVEAGTHQFYIYGTIRYRDAFWKQRYSNFRLVREPTTQYMAACGEGNEAD